MVETKERRRTSRGRTARVLGMRATPVSELQGDALNAAIAEKIMEYPGLGYYGPPPGADPWKHDEGIRFNTRAEAKKAYTAYCARMYPHGTPIRKTNPEFFIPKLSYWLEGFGPKILEDFSTDVGAAWRAVEAYKDAPTPLKKDELRNVNITIRWNGEQQNWFCEIFGKNGEIKTGEGEKAATAICRALLFEPRKRIDNPDRLHA